MLKPQEFDQYVLKNDDGIPLRMYRGFHSENVDEHLLKPFVTSAGRALPTFTTSPDMAQLYAHSPNDRKHMNLKSRGAVGIYEIAMKNPVDLNSKEDIVDYYILKDLLGEKMNTQQWQAFWEWSLDNVLWIYEGDPMERQEVLAMTDEERGKLYIDTYYVCDNPGVLALFKQLGYDGYIYRGTAPVFEDQFERSFEEASKDGSFDGRSMNCAEFRPFHQTQVRFALSQEPIQYYRPEQENAVERVA